MERMSAATEMNQPTPRARGWIPFLRARWTARRTLGLLAFLALMPGAIVGCLYVVSNLYPPYVAPMEKDPSSLGMAFEPLKLRSADGVHLEGWYIPPEGTDPAPAVAICHGHKGRMDQFLHQAKFLHDAGFGVGMVNLRMHGGSERAMITMGIREGEDFRSIISYLAEHPRHRDQLLGALGYSMGAVTVLRTAYLDDRIAAIVADSPFHALTDEAYHRLVVLSGPFSNYFYAFVMGFGCIATGNWPSDWNVTDWVQSMKPRPVFLIHGESDNNIPPISSHKLEMVLTAQKETWYVKDSGHIEARKKYADVYVRRVTSFFNRHLRGINDPPLTSVSEAAEAAKVNSSE